MDDVKRQLTLKRETLAAVERAPLREAVQAIPLSGEIVVQEGDNLWRVATRYQVPQSIVKIIIWTRLMICMPDRRCTYNQPAFILWSHRFAVQPVWRYAVSQFELAREPAIPDLTIGQELRLLIQLICQCLNLTGLIRMLAHSCKSGPIGRRSQISGTCQVICCPGIGAGGFTWPLEGEVIKNLGRPY